MSSDQEEYFVDSDDEGSEVIELNETIPNEADEDWVEIDDNSHDPATSLSISDSPSTANDLMELLDDSTQGFFAHQEPVYAIAIHPHKPDLIVSGGGDDNAYVWSMHDGEIPIYKLVGHTDSVVSVGFSKDGKWIATGGMDGHIKIWSNELGTEHCHFETGSDIIWMEWHPYGPILVVGLQDGTLWMVNGSLGVIMNVFSGVHCGAVSCGQFTLDGKKLISGSEDGSLALWDPRSTSPDFQITPAHAKWFQDEEITSVACNDVFIIAGGSEGNIRVLLLANGNLLSSYHFNQSLIESIAMQPTRSFVALASTDNKVVILDLTHQCQRGTLEHHGAVIKAQYTIDGAHLITCSTDGSVRAWDALSNKLVHQWVGHQEPILSMSMTPNAEVIVTGGDDGKCLVFYSPERTNNTLGDTKTVTVMDRLGCKNIKIKI